MTTTGSLSGLIDFIERSAWADALGEVLAEHLGPACLSAEVDPDEIRVMLGSHVAGTLWGCVLEDMMAREYGDGRNVVDEYLRHRGHTESAGAKRYLKALRGAVMSLYEVSGVEPGVAFLARGLIRGGDPVRVLDKSATQSLKAWGRISARLIRWGAEWRMGGGVLLFGRPASEFLIEELKKMQAGELPDDLRDRGHRPEQPMPTLEAERGLADGEPLRQLGPTFTSIWLGDALTHVLDPRLPQLYNTDGEPIVMCTSVFRMQTGIKAGQCRVALARTSELQEASSKLFNWVRGADDELG